MKWVEIKLVSEDPGSRIVQLAKVRIASKLDHRRRATEQHQGMVTWRIQVFGNHFIIHKACAISPLWK